MTFQYQEQQLHIEQLPISAIAANVSTPFYCYSQTAITTAYQDYKKHLGVLDAQVCYAIKANSNQAVIKTLADEGAGADVVSEGELRRAIMAGVPASKIIFSGVAKTSKEMEYALSQDIFQFNIESENELYLLDKIARSLNKKAKIAFRINPDVDAKTHQKISTGLSENKFGIPISKAREIYQRATKLEGIQIQGVDLHIGSQLLQLEPFEQAFILLKNLVENLHLDGHNISVIDVGGGLGIDYKNQTQKAPSKSEYCSLLVKHFGNMNCKIILEPGRSLVAQSGVLVSKVIYIKQGEKRVFVIIDAAMNDLLRPSMYDAHHNILPVKETDAQACYDIVGPVCETGDTFARNRTMAELHEDDLVVINNAGAYGAVMSSTYNTRLLLPEVLVKGNQYSLIRERQDYDRLINQDNLAPWQERSQ
ncbi:MAG: diaminopimelate decarboxylase [Gammaproteobacteria bacterium]|nr:diaminopimelate decarboxylase [Gammaproteobacteria bacterium]